MTEKFEFKSTTGEIITIDLEDKDLVFSHSDTWFCGKNKKGKIYYVRCYSSLIDWHIDRYVSLSRLVMKCEKNDRVEVDHRNGNVLDNRKENLRLATRSQNGMNKGKLSLNSSSKYKGVFWSKGRGIWMAQIKINGRKIYLGRFNEELDAAKAYDVAAKKYHGEFARCNF